MALNEQRIANMVARWNELRCSGLSNDWAIAEFFRDERFRSGNYRAGQHGDETFKDDVNANLVGISGSKALHYARLVRNNSEESWVNLGGYPSLQYLEKLDCTTAVRNRIRAAVLGEAARNGQPATKHICQKHARAAGLDQPSITRSELERKWEALAEFIVANVDPDDVPWSVVEEMPARLQAQYT